MVESSKDNNIQGFTTNPTLMKKSGVEDYESFAKEVIKSIPDKPISFEVFSDEIHEMQKEAQVISSWGGLYICKNSSYEHSRCANLRINQKAI